MRRKYIFVKAYKTNEGVIPAGTEIIIFRGNVYMDGGLVHPAYQRMLIDLLSDEKLRHEYFIEREIIENKV